LISSERRAGGKKQKMRKRWELTRTKSNKKQRKLSKSKEHSRAERRADE
jgi:hypothetical protein